MACLFCSYLFAECWFGPTMSLLLQLSNVKGRGVYVSLYLFMCLVIGNMSPVLLGELDTNHTDIGYYILLFVAVSYCSSIILFSILAYRERVPKEKDSSEIKYIHMEE